MPNPKWSLLLCALICLSAGHRQITMRSYSELALSEQIALAEVVDRSDTSFTIRVLDNISGCKIGEEHLVYICSRHYDMPCDHSLNYYEAGDTILLHFSNSWGDGRAGEEVVRFRNNDLIYHRNSFNFNDFNRKYGVATSYKFSLNGFYRFDYRQMKTAYLDFRQNYKKLYKKTRAEPWVKSGSSKGFYDPKSVLPSVWRSRFLRKFSEISPSHEFLVDQLANKEAS